MRRRRHRLVLTVDTRQEAVDAVVMAMPPELGWPEKLAAAAVDAITREVPTPRKPPTKETP